MWHHWKRLAWIVGAITATAVVATSLAAATTGGSSQTLNIYGFGPGDDVANNRIAFATKALAGVTIENPRGGFNNQQFLTALAAGDVPDLVYIDRRSVGTFAAKRVFQPLSNCIKSQSIDVKQYRTAALEEVRYKGSLYAIPEFTQPVTLLLNDDVLKEAGVSAASIQTTKWAVLRQANKKLLKIEDGKVTRIGFDPKIPDFFPLWVKWFGGDLTSKDGLKAQLNSRQAIAALEFTYSLIRDHGGWDRFKAFRDTWDFFGRQNQVARNQIAAWPQESWYYNVLADNSPQVNITTKYFTNRKGGPITQFSGAGWAIPKGAKNPDLACRWAKAITSVDSWLFAAKERFDLRKRQGRAFTGLYTANARADVKIYEDIYQPLDKKQWDTTVSLLVRASRYGITIPVSPAGAEIKQAYIDAVNRVLEGRMTPRQALNQAQLEAQAAIDKNK